MWSNPCVQIAAASCWGLAIWAFSELSWWQRFHKTATDNRINFSQENATEAAIQAMSDRIASQISTLDEQYRVKINKLYYETQSKLDAMDEVLRNRLPPVPDKTTSNMTFEDVNDGEESVNTNTTTRRPTKFSRFASTGSKVSLPQKIIVQLKIQNLSIKCESVVCIYLIHTYLAAVARTGIQTVLDWFHTTWTSLCAWHP